MKNFISRLTTTLVGFLDEWLSDPEIEDFVTDIRQAMLDCMSAHLASEDKRPPVWNKVFYASSLQTLWYSRTDLMVFLSEHCGEVLARERLMTLTKNSGALCQLLKCRSRGRPSTDF
jgi:hypothetical protein